MSKINNALSDISQQQSNKRSIERVEVNTASRRSTKPWLAVATLGIFVASGAWAWNKFSPSTAEETPRQEAVLKASDPAPSEAAVAGSLAIASTATVSPAKASLAPEALVTESPAAGSPAAGSPAAGTPVSETATANTVVAKTPVQSETKVQKNQVQTQQPKPEAVKAKAEPKPALVQQKVDQQKAVPSQKSASRSSESVTEQASGSEVPLVVEQVELTTAQLAENAYARAEKALDASDMPAALKAFSEVLRYSPTNETARQKLAALYFGKGETRQAYEILQKGIRLSPDSEALRLSLARLLVKAEQETAALSPLVHLPTAPSRDYLAMRAALAQKVQQDAIALESYQRLTELESDNARWWLGLAIQQERALDFKQARQAYRQALNGVGISNQSQQFIQERLRVLKQIEGK